MKSNNAVSTLTTKVWLVPGLTVSEPALIRDPPIYATWVNDLSSATLLTLTSGVKSPALLA